MAAAAASPTSCRMSPSLDPQRIPAPEKFVDALGAFSLDGALPPAVRPAEAVPENCRSFSEVSCPETIRSICHSKVPGWSSLRAEEITIDQICEGLSNQLFKVHVDVEGATSTIPCVLFRIYGKDVATLYDQDLEISIFNTLSKYQVAPRMYANGEGWRIEEWHFAVPLKTRYMRNPSILTQVASQLGRFHKLSRRHDFPRRILDLQPASVSRLLSWGDGCRRAADKLKKIPEMARLPVIQAIDEVLADRDWLRGFVEADPLQIRGSGLDIVFSHNDVQENNILQTHYGLRFIDFEYSSMDYQSFDIANYFCECMFDYTYERYPFYAMSLSDFPTEWEQRLFCAIYLSEYLESKVKLDDAAVTRLLSSVARFTLMSHYLWCIWSVIRAPQASTFNEFDFLRYAQDLWDSYKRRKHALLQEANASPAEAPRPAAAAPATSQGDSRRSRVDSGNSLGRPRKEPYVLGGLLTGGGVLLGAAAVVVVARMLKK